MTVSLVDGLGGEELGQAGSQVSNLWITGSIVSDSIISGAQIFSTGSVQAERIADANGIIKSSSLGSPGQFGALIQAGSFATSAGSIAAVSFRNAYSAAGNYIFWAFPKSGPSLMTNGSVHCFTSGTANNGKNTSGVNVVGAASMPYDYLAIGI